MKQTVYPLILLVALLCSGCVKELDFVVLSATSEDTAMGSVVGGGTYRTGTTVTLNAIPNSGCYFIQWADGNTDNPRTVVADSDLDFVAQFGSWNNASFSIKFGDKEWSDVYNAQFRHYSSSQALRAQFYERPGSTYPTNYPNLFLLLEDLTLSKGTTDYTYEQLHSHRGYSSLQYFEKSYVFGPNVFKEEVYHGDWWAKSAIVTIPAIDLSNKKMNINIQAVMYDAVNRNQSVTRNLTIDFKSVEIVVY